MLKILFSSFVFFAAFGAFADVKTENLGQLVREYAVKGNQKRWQIDQFGNKTTYKYNSMGQLVTTQIDGKTNMEYRYSKDGRLGTIRDELGRITKHKYDIFGRLTELVNPLGQTSKSIYDAYGRLVEQTGAGKYPLQYQYTPFGEISSYVDKNASTTRFEYDNSGRLIKLICPNGSAIEYKYDKFGRLVVKTEADRVTGYFYSERGNLIKVHISQGLNQHHTTQMEYNDRGQMVSISAEGLTTRFAYDHFGRKLLEESPMGTFTYMYNEKGLLSARQAQFKGSNEKFITNYKYDNFNRVVEVSSPAGSYKYIWGKNNKIAAIEFGNGQKIVYSYDKADRLTGKRLGDKVLVAYTYDALDRRIAATYLGVSWKYAYDQYSQLIKAESSLNEKYEYDYDAIGNRTKAITLASTQKFTFNNLNQINTNGYVYDAWGNMVKAPGIKYKYDLKNRLVEYKKGGLTISYTYDALDQRINAVQNGKRTDFLMSGMVEYARKAGNKAQYHTLGLDLQNSLDRTSAVGAILASSDAFGSGFNYLYDGSGNVIASCDNGGVIKDKLTYSPFGRQTSGAKLLFTFSTKAVDQSNMSYYGYRFYSTDLGRWNKKDPLLDIDFYSTHLTGKPIFYEAAKIIKNNFNKYQNILTLHQFLISKISTLSRLQFEKLQINHLNNRQYAFVNNNTINRGNFKSI